MFPMLTEGSLAAGENETSIQREAETRADKTCAERKGQVL